MSRPDILPLPDSKMIAFAEQFPREYLRGTQVLKEYRGSSQRDVERGIHQEGYGFLLKYPIEVVATKSRDPDNTEIMIYQGHHRVRYSPQFDSLPVKLFLVDDVLDDLAQTYRIKTEQVISHLIRSSILAESSFYRSYLDKGKTFQKKSSFPMGYEHMRYEANNLSEIDPRIVIRSSRSPV